MLHPLIVVPDVTWQRKAMMIAAPHKAGAPEAKGLPSINQPIMHPNLSETKQACRKDTNQPPSVRDLSVLRTLKRAQMRGYVHRRQ
jgi:hypothetical protein